MSKNVFQVEGYTTKYGERKITIESIGQNLSSIIRPYDKVRPC